MSIPGCGDNPAPTVDDIAEFKELRTVYEKYCTKNGPGNVTIVTIIQHSKCCELDLGSAYYDDVVWFLATEREPYPTIHIYGDYLKTELISVEGFTVPKMVPKIIIVDKDQKVASASDYSGAGSLSSKIDEVLKGGGHEPVSIFSITPVPASMYGSMFVLGVITCAAPCCIALFVSTVSYIISVCMRKIDGKDIRTSTARGATIGALFTLGMALVFFLIGCLVMYLNVFVQKSIIADLFIAITGSILVLFGMDNIGAFDRIKSFLSNKFESYRYKRRINKDKDAIIPIEKRGTVEKLRLAGLKISKHRVNIGSFLLGLLFGVAWAPCALSLIFPVLLIMMTQKVTVLTGGLLLFLFGLGHGIPFVPLASATSAVRAKMTEKMMKTGNVMIKIFGVIIIVLGVLMIMNFFGYDFGVAW
jgi:cytochrome c-type biogenesis protein